MEKIKRIITYCLESEKGKDILIVIIVILVGLGSFELGRLSKSGSNAGIKIEYPDQNANVISSVESSSLLPVRNASHNDAGGQNYKTSSKETSIGKTLFASKQGSKYYSLGCSAGKTIKQENRIYFATREEAEKAGYELSNSCR